MNWDLTYHFKNEEEFNNALEQVKSLIDEFASFEGKLHEEESFVKYLLLNKKFEIEASKV